MGRKYFIQTESAEKCAQVCLSSSGFTLKNLAHTCGGTISSHALPSYYIMKEGPFPFEYPVFLIFDRQNPIQYRCLLIVGQLDIAG
jgi:hypothetical protein